MDILTPGSSPARKCGPAVNMAGIGSVLVTLTLAWLCLGANSVFAYEYPIADPYLATIAGTPDALQAPLPADINVKDFRLTVFTDRTVPEIVWHEDRLRYSVAAQKGRAPLVFVIAGTGSSHRAPNMQVLQKALFAAGFHVIALPSPTHPNFVVSASATRIPGDLRGDARDLYRVMKLVRVQLGKRIDVSAFHLTGYSLGAAQAAFVAKLDETERAFDFQKVLMINPPVSLHSSVARLDRMLDDNIPGGLDNFNAYFNEIMAAFSDVYQSGDFVEFNDELFYAAYEQYRPDARRLQALIGFAFRIASANMVFTSDVVTHSGFIVPASLSLTSHDSVTDYFKVSARTTFLDYFDGMLFPFFQRRQPGLTQEQLLASLSLRSIEDYLRSSTRIGLVHNEDDIILAPGELDYLRGLFQSRAMIYPRGGHLGNLAYKDNVAHVVEFFRR